MRMRFPYTFGGVGGGGGGVIEIRSFMKLTPESVAWNNSAILEVICFCSFELNSMSRAWDKIARRHSICQTFQTEERLCDDTEY